MPHFWDKFIHKTKSYDIKPEVARWYVRHAEAFIKTRAKRLVQQSSHGLENYLNEKGCNLRIKDWQYKQTVMSIQKNLVEMVKLN